MLLVCPADLGDMLAHGKYALEQGIVVPIKG
uniref:Uncharacterized protein n=1 Tax=Arundo donax TaxID=35708 RepID=A0A0A9E849_ARUDO